MFHRSSRRMPNMGISSTMLLTAVKLQRLFKCYSCQRKFTNRMILCTEGHLTCDKCCEKSSNLSGCKHNIAGRNKVGESMVKYINLIWDALFIAPPPKPLQCTQFVQTDETSLGYKCQINFCDHESSNQENMRQHAMATHQDKMISLIHNYIEGAKDINKAALTFEYKFDMLYDKILNSYEYGMTFLCIYIDYQGNLVIKITIPRISTIRLRYTISLLQPGISAKMVYSGVVEKLTLCDNTHQNTYHCDKSFYSTFYNRDKINRYADVAPLLFIVQITLKPYP